MRANVHAHGDLCTLLFFLCRNKLNLPMCSFLLCCAWFPPLLNHCDVMLATLLCCTDFFVSLFLQKPILQPSHKSDSSRLVSIHLTLRIHALAWCTGYCPCPCYHPCNLRKKGLRQMMKSLPLGKVSELTLPMQNSKQLVQNSFQIDSFNLTF